MNLSRIVIAATALASLSVFGADNATIVARPETASTNSFYISNRAPLEPSQFIPLPINPKAGCWKS